MEPVELPTLLEAYVRDGLNHVHKAMPAIVDAYDATTQTCTVHVAVKQPLPDGTYQEFPALSGIKVGHLRGGGFIVATPLVKGDAVLLIFLDQSPAEWHQTGAVGEPKDTRRHGLYCYALPVAFPDSAAAVSASASALRVGYDGGNRLIEVTASMVKLGLDATQFVALAGLSDQVQALKAVLSGWTPVANDGGAALKTALATWLSTTYDTVATATKAK